LSARSKVGVLMFLEGRSASAGTLSKSASSIGRSVRVARTSVRRAAPWPNGCSSLSAGSSGLSAMRGKSSTISATMATRSSVKAERLASPVGACMRSSAPASSGSMSGTVEPSHEETQIFGLFEKEPESITTPQSAEKASAVGQYCRSPRCAITMPDATCTTCTVLSCAPIARVFESGAHARPITQPLVASSRVDSIVLRSTSESTPLPPAAIRLPSGESIASCTRFAPSATRIGVTAAFSLSVEPNACPANSGEMRARSTTISLSCCFSATTTQSFARTM